MSEIPIFTLAIAVIGVGNGYDVGTPPGMAADAPDDLRVQDLFDLFGTEFS